VVGVSGHMDLDPDDIPGLRGSIASFLQELKHHLPETEIHIIVGMAAGADLLVAETALDMGVHVEAVLPMALEHYAADFDDETLSLLKGMLARRNVRCTELRPPPHPGRGVHGGDAAHRDAMYANLTETLIRRSSLLLALWDGRSLPLPGGTADTVLRFLGIRTDANMTANSIVLVDAAEVTDSTERLVYWIPAVRSSGPQTASEHQPCFLRAVGDNTLLMQRAMPASLAFQLNGLDRYNREYRELVASGGLATNDSLLATLPPDAPLHEEMKLADIDAQYVKADSLAMHYQLRSDSLFRLFGVMTFTMGLAYLIYEKLTESKVLLMAYLLILLGSLGLYYGLRERHWFAKHLTYRALAETMRAKFYLRLAGVDHRVNASEVLGLSGIDRFHGFGWISLVLAGVEVPDVRAETIHDMDLRRTRCVEKHWIESQHGYFTRKVASLDRSSHRIKLLRNTVFIVILLVILALFLFGDVMGGDELHPGINLRNMLTFSMGFLAVLLGAWELQQDKMATRELLWQYRNQLIHFARAKLELLRFATPNRRHEVLVSLGKDSLMECYLWTIHRYHREHEPPTGG
jgi:hypothetical protein